MRHFALLNPLNSEFTSLVLPIRDWATIERMLSDFIEEILMIEFDEVRCHLQQQGYDDLCMPLFRCLARELVRGDIPAVQESCGELRTCAPSSERVNQFWSTIELIALLLRGLWFHVEKQAFEMGIALAELGKGCLAKRIYQASTSHPFFLGALRLAQGGVA